MLGVALLLSGCVKKVKTKDLLSDIKVEEVTGKAVDETFVNSQYDLSIKLLKESIIDEKSKGKNILVSPLSIMLALSMTANGANEATKTEMEAVLGGGITIEDINEYLYTYTNSLPTDKNCKLKIANSIWYRNDNRLNVKNDFLQTVKNYYKAQIYKESFDNATLNDVNSWVNENTDGMIEKILDEISKDDIMYLINALVFDAKWDIAYENNSVKEDKFTNIKGEIELVKMMTSSESKYLVDENAEGFLKPHKDNKYSFAALLPNEGINVYDYINSLTKDKLSNILNNIQKESLKVTMPKFTYEYSIEMNNVLKNIGMQKAFNQNLADFTKMATYDTENIYIGEVLHKTFISVDEKGTKAAAVTSSGIVKSAAPVEQRIIKLDRPFVYMILDNQTNIPIFIGALTSIEK